jgi:hypothetical protein
MSESDNQQQQQEDSHEDHTEIARNALIFSLLFILMVIALWGYVYLTLLERGMVQ